MKFIMLAGGIGAGKSSAAVEASARAGVSVLKMRDVLADATGADRSDRAVMQERAAALDQATEGQWLVEYLEGLHEQDRAIIDAVRTLRQAQAVIKAFDTNVIYLDATEIVRRRRYELGSKSDPMKAASSFEEAMSHPTELEALRIRDVADTVIDTNSIGVAAVADLIVAQLDA